MPVTPPPASQKRSPLVYVAAGCGALLILAALVVGTGFYFLKRKAAEMAEQNKDPELRAAKARELLHADRLPDGYYAVAAMSVPMLDVVVLGDQPPRASGAPTSPALRGLIYTRMFREPANVTLLRAFVAGESNDPSAMRATGIDLATRQIIRRGTLSLGGGTVLYCAQRGTMTARGASARGLQVVSLTDCPDRNLRMSIWFGPDPDPSRPVAELDLAGSVADENELRRFLSHFGLCGPES
jgi:hypothetical protein